MKIMFLVLSEISKNKILFVNKCCVYKLILLSIIIRLYQIYNTEYEIGTIVYKKESVINIILFSL